MNIPSPYFEGVPGIGDLEMEEILVDYDYPLLSVLKSQSGQRFLCMCYDVSGERENVIQRWIIISISLGQLTELLQNKIKLLTPFQEPEAVKLLVEWKFSTKAETYTQLSEEQKLPEECLPAEDEYLDAEPNEWDEYIAALNSGQTAHLSEDYIVTINQKDIASLRFNFPPVTIQIAGIRTFSSVLAHNTLYAQEEKYAVPLAWSRTGVSEVRYGGQSVFANKRYTGVSLQGLGYGGRTVQCSLSR